MKSIALQNIQGMETMKITEDKNAQEVAKTKRHFKTRKVLRSYSATKLQEL